MENLIKLIAICQAYKAGAFGVEEFQHKLESVYLPDECKYTLEKIQHNAFNHLEKIFYFYPEEEHKQHANKVADELIQATILEQKRLKEYSPYQK